MTKEREVSYNIGDEVRLKFTDIVGFITLLYDDYGVVTVIADDGTRIRSRVKMNDLTSYWERV